MRYYAHYGHTDFILCLGYRGDLIREYFLNYRETMSNDFTWTDAGRSVELHSTDVSKWRITFVDTGLHSNIGQRLLRVRQYVKDEPVFLANYADGLSDIPLDEVIADFERKQVIASFAAVQSAASFHLVHSDGDGYVSAIGQAHVSQFLVNGGFFVLKQQIFDYIREGDELVEQPFGRLIKEKQLASYRHLGFWQAMDNFKDKITFDRMEAQGKCPWAVWKK
jgi:glucose-1-phosphate cytidylyltransferase